MATVKLERICHQSLHKRDGIISLAELLPVLSFKLKACVRQHHHVLFYEHSLLRFAFESHGGSSIFLGNNGGKSQAPETLAMSGSIFLFRRKGARTPLR